MNHNITESVDKRPRPRILLMLYRPLDIRLAVSSRLLHKLVKQAEVTVLIPEDMQEYIRDQLGSSLQIELLRYNTQLDVDSFFLRSMTLKRSARAFFNNTFRLVYAGAKGKDNATRKALLKNYKENNSKKPFWPRYAEHIMVALANLASRYRWVRSGLQRFFYLLYATDTHQDIFEKHQPDLAVVCSLGHVIDAPFLAECKRHNILTVSVLQSWDHSSTKGYPHLHANYVILWNESMSEECCQYHDMAPDNIFVEGVHLWDHYFTTEGLLLRKEFCDKYNLDPDKKIIYCALCGDMYHQGNKDLVHLLCQALQEGWFAKDSQIIFRMHPMYLQKNADAKLKDLVRLLEKQSATIPDVHVLNPLVDSRYPYSLLAEEDKILLKNILCNCEVCISVVSTQMVEACIMDKPAIAVEYGHWKTNVVDTELQNYVREHLERIYRYNAICRAKTPKELIEYINDNLTGKMDLSAQRRQLAEQETWVNRGNATESVAARLIWLARKATQANGLVSKLVASCDPLRF